ncbi:glucokinase [Arthrobacter sp. V4I6]|uniref:ROK family protein n=1 Tax=unclassified Arthrobacter TaxID=235627 RepID=UPI002780FC90|nr:MULTISPECIES: ROK family protein [unclassified Arthrobacter]MDQ0822438.1 glucokinase [Arthrobacter sp. V1I7]MDQ0852064.1 glucokinase [Arthrobacter sp. V4I6]
MGTGNEIVDRRTVPTPETSVEGSAAEFLAAHIAQVTRGREIAATGICASGPVDPDGVIRNPDTLPAFTGLPIVADLLDAFGVPVVTDNDAVCAALAEQRIGAAQGASSLLHITLGTGIGACLLTHGMPLRGGDGMHPESGHISVRIPTPPCYCGREACWEQAASRQALQRTAASLLGKDPTDQAAIAELAALADNGEAPAAGVFHDFGLAVADGLSTLLAVYRPQAVVLGGSGADHFRIYKATVTQALSRLGDWIPKDTLAKTKLDDYGGATGAAFLALTAVDPRKDGS